MTQFSKASLGELSLDAQYRTISLEAHAGEEGLQSALARLPGFFKEVGARLSSLMDNSIDAFWRPKDLNWAAHVLMAHPYQDIREKEMPALPSLKVDYLTYTTALASDAELCASFQKTYLDPLTRIVAEFLSDSEHLGMHRPIDELSHYSLDAMSKHSKATARMLDGAHGDSVRPYGKMIKRQNDWMPIIKHVEYIGKTFAEADHTAFSYKVGRLNDLLNKLLERATTDSSIYRISGPVLDSITRAAYVTANAVEFYGMTYRRAMSLEEALNRLVDNVKAMG